MEILAILKGNQDDLLPEDFALFRTELAVGSYSEEYKKECLDLIKTLENWNKENKKAKQSRNNGVAAGKMNISQIVPAQNISQISFLEQFKADLTIMRTSESYKNRFKTYIKTHEEFDESFVDVHFNMFDSNEMGAVLLEMQLSEAFLEKYFTALDKDKIARYQQFSESFFQRHFADFDAETVLKKGKNEWRKKEKRSKQLDVFLRLKGVKF
ncbi:MULTISPECIES: hypothetical protein [Clostridia]|uniref:hypothetical protein n=1 Tax=Clostridia TaxID=186801 RepID=UPI00191C2E81|nr:MULTISPECIES: hypothetical protein [Clostridia]